jgi:molybdopterin converting factor small subunit
MRVRLPSPLYGYTDGVATVEADGADLRSVLADLDSRFPGLRFRVVDEQDGIRPHIRFFVAGVLVRTITHPVGPDDEVMIVAALSGG